MFRAVWFQNTLVEMKFSYARCAEFRRSRGRQLLAEWSRPSWEENRASVRCGWNARASRGKPSGSSCRSIGLRPATAALARIRFLPRRRADFFRSGRIRCREDSNRWRSRDESSRAPREFLRHALVGRIADEFQREVQSFKRVQRGPPAARRARTAGGTAQTGRPTRQASGAPLRGYRSRRRGARVQPFSFAPGDCDSSS